jgi:hypothetical protein
MFTPEEIAELRSIRPERVTASRVVSPTPCLLFSVALASDGVGEADAGIYNGQGLGDELLYDLFAVDEAMDSLIFPYPVYLSKGLYIAIGTNVASVTVQYRRV